MLTRIQSWVRSHIWTLFPVGMAIVYLCAFTSYYLQIDELFGPQGLSPISGYLSYLDQALNHSSFWSFPTLFWLGSGTAALKLVAVVGMLAATAFAIGILPWLSATTAWLCYLSIVNAGGRFMSFQWDILLLEAGFLCVFLFGLSLRRGHPNRWVVYLLQWLVFRLMFASGAVKLISGDASWQNWTALTYHFETTPLPNILSWWAHQLPDAVLRSFTGLTFFVELFVPLLIFVGVGFRMAAGWVIIGFMVAVAATGNYTFFNLLTMVLALSLFAVRPMVDPRQPRASSTVTFVVCGLVFLLSWVPFSRVLPMKPPTALEVMHQLSARWFITNGYGLFANMTEVRPELVFEISQDGQQWEPVELHYKPGPLDRPPKQIAPHQPRVDWQLWFAALGSPQRNRWVFDLAAQLCRPPGQTPIQTIFVQLPAQPVNYVRVRRYIYQMTSVKMRRQSGNYWLKNAGQAYGTRLQC